MHNFSPAKYVNVTLEVERDTAIKFKDDEIEAQKRALKCKGDEIEAQKSSQKCKDDDIEAQSRALEEKDFIVSGMREQLSTMKKYLTSYQLVS